MIVNKFSMPKEISYDYGDACELDELDLKYLIDQGIEEIWYWYETGSYEGTGAILMRKGNEYSVYNMSHCSCNGPTNEIYFKGEDFNKLEDSITGGWKKEVSILFDAARGSNKPAWKL